MKDPAEPGSEDESGLHAAIRALHQRVAALESQAAGAGVGETDHDALSITVHHFISAIDTIVDSRQKATPAMMATYNHYLDLLRAACGPSREDADEKGA